MARIEDYAIIGNTHTAALVSRGGSVDWMCVPRFDSAACLAALVGKPENGRFLLAPSNIKRTTRRYRPGTLILETEHEADGGVVRVIDFMPMGERDPSVVRIVEGVSGEVAMNLELVVRFDYGSVVPWVRHIGHGVRRAVGGPDALELKFAVEPKGEGMTSVARFSVKAKERLPFILRWQRSHEASYPMADAEESLRKTEARWSDWAARCTFEGEWENEVLGSLVTLKALTYAPTGGLVAAATTSLPEWPGSVRNWDYRYCWLRDATFTLMSLLSCGFKEEAAQWRDWLLRAVAGDPSKLQIMYGLGGERRLGEYELPWLSGFEDSKPVRVGNAAADQLQLDVYGEVIDALYHADRAGLHVKAEGWSIQRTLLEFLEGCWNEPDEGLWEVRGGRQHFTHSKMLAWVAFDRAVKSAERFRLDGPIAQWRKQRDAIHADICKKAWNDQKKAFAQSYGSDHLDAAVLLMPLVGFLPHTDDRVHSTVAAIERELLKDGFVLRYSTGENGSDGLPPGEGAFLACTFWLADNYALCGRMPEARAVFERLLQIRNDVGLLAEEYDPKTQRQLGNFPQAFSHVGLVNTALNLSPDKPSPAESRCAP